MRIRYFALVALLAAPLPLLSDELGEELLAAARKSNVEVVKTLLAKGADVNAKSPYGQTPLFFACDRGNIEIVKMLLDKGADLNVKDTFYNSTALTWAAQNKRVEVVKLLLDKGANGADEVLMSGVEAENVDMIKAALSSGKLKPADLTNALAAAEKAKKDNLAAMLKQAGAKPRPPANFQVAPETLATYAGKYQGGRGGTEMEMNVSVENGKLKATTPGTPLTLAAIDNTHFRGVEFDQVEFEFLSQQGKVTGMKLVQGGFAMEFKRVEAK
jgi:Ankyrin repeats (3 copies)/Domain of unknown function (DUF3471)